MKILIADDNSDNRELLKYMARQHGHKTIEASDGRIALAKARKHRPDVVISDVMMPVMDGFQLLRALKTNEDLRRIPFILFSALYNSQQDRKLAESLGASAFVTKPMKLDEIWGHVESVMKEPPHHPGPEKEPVPSDNEFRESHVQIVISKLKEKVEQLEKETEERKAVEQALRASEERFRRLVESTTDYIYTVQVTKGRPVSTAHGPGCIAITGYTPEEYEVDPELWFRMIPGEERDAVFVQASRVLAGERPPAMEHRIIHKNGSIRWVRNTAVPRFNEKGDLIACDGLIADITECKQAEAALRESEAKFRLLAENIQDVFWISTPAIDRMIYVSPAFERIWGRTCASLYQQPLSFVEAIHPEDQGRVFAALQEHARGKWDIEYRIIRPDGSVRWILDRGFPVRDERGELVSMCGVAKDITERKNIETALLERERLLSETGRMAHVGGWEFNPETLEGTWTEEVARIHEVSPGLPIDVQTGLSYFRGESREKIEMAVREAVERGKPYDLELELITAKGNHKWVRTIGQPVEEGNKVVRVRGSFQDITERKLMEMKIRRASSEWALTFDSMADGVSVHSADHTILRVNETLCRILGKSRDELLGKKCYQLFHCTEEPIDDCPLTRALETRGKECHERFEPTIGGGRWVSIAASPVLDEKGEVTRVIHVVRDITEQKERERRLQRQLQHMAALHSIDLAITSSLDLHVMLGVVLDKVAAELDIDAANILLLNPHLQTLEYASGRGFRTQALRHTHLRIGECYAGRAASERRVINVPDLTDAPGEFVRAKLLADEGFVTYYAAPLIAKGQVKGVLELFHRNAFHADDDWLDFLQTLATQAAIAIDNASLFDELQRSNTDLIQAYETTLEGWSRAMDLRDKETEGHCRRVAEMTLRMARIMGVSGGDQAHMYRGALLHDIGKIGVPDAILLKPDGFTEAEKETMKRHTTQAHELLFPIHFLRPAIDIPYCHHEMWDGQGYPRGLKGEEIPLAARIFSVVDVWDALRSDRPYRPAWPEEKVRQYIRSLAGVQFDPKVVDIFLSMEW